MISEHAISVPLDVVLMTTMAVLFFGGSWLIHRVSDEED